MEDNTTFLYKIQPREEVNTVRSVNPLAQVNSFLNIERARSLSRIAVNKIRHPSFSSNHPNAKRLSTHLACGRKSRSSSLSRTHRNQLARDLQEDAKMQPFDLGHDDSRSDVNTSSDTGPDAIPDVNNAAGVDNSSPVDRNQDATVDDSNATSAAADNGSSTSRNATGAVQEDFGFANEDEKGLDLEGEYIEDEDEDYAQFEKEMQAKLQKEPSRVRMIGKMKLTIASDAHEVIMGYKKGEGPALEPFTSTESSSAHQPVKFTSHPPRSTSLADVPNTPTPAVRGSLVDRLSRPTAASSSRTSDAATGRATPRQPASADRRAIPRPIASDDRYATPRQPSSAARRVPSVRVVADSAGNNGGTPTPIVRKTPGSTRDVSSKQAPKKVLEKKDKSDKNNAEPQKSTFRSVFSSMLPTRAKKTMSGKKESKAPATTAESQRERDMMDMGFIPNQTVPQTTAFFTHGLGVGRNGDDRDDPNLPSRGTAGPAGHYGEAEADAATVGGGNDADSAEDQGGDTFDESGVGAFLDYQIQNARANLNTVRELAQNVEDADLRAEVLQTVSNQEILLSTMTHLRDANISANRATAALVRNLSASVASATRAITAAVHSRT